MEKVVYAMSWGAMLVLALILIGAWVYPQYIMKGAPRLVLIALGVLWIVVVCSGLVSAWKFRKRR